ncbi:MAG: HAMP domain-containing sensor histidine kinase, partial [Chloroflexota bacterium]
FAKQLMDNWDKYADKDKKYILNIISKNSGKAAAIVDELLALASIRQQDVSIERVDMADVFFQVEQRTESLLQKSGCRLIMPDDWPIVWGYSPWIEEVWVNYLTNAIKYGGNHKDIEIGYTIIDDLTAKFWVKDFGPGLSEEDQSIVFKQYVRIKGSNQEGHGLGLAIAKRIINKLNGDVGVKSKVGEGCLFYFTLPLPIPEVDKTSLLELTNTRY